MGEYHPYYDPKPEPLRLTLEEGETTQTWHARQLEYERLAEYFGRPSDLTGFLAHDLHQRIVRILDGLEPDPRGSGPTCPKCGATDGWTGPTFRRTSEMCWPPVPSHYHALPTMCEVERLAFACRRCGYERAEPTKDALPPRPPPEPPNVSSLGSELKRSGPGWWRRVMAGWVIDPLP